MPISRNIVISSIIWNLLERFSSQIVSFVISIILARILMPGDYGIIAIVLVFVNLAGVIVDGGLNTALIQKKDADQTDFSTIFWFCLLLSVVLYLALFIVAPIIAGFYDNDVLTGIVRVLSLILISNSFNSIQRAYVSRNMLFKKLFWINALSIVLSGLIGIVMAYNGFGVWAIVGQTLANSFFGCFLLWICISWRPSMVFSIDRFRGLFEYGWKIFLSSFIISIYNNAYSLVIGKVYQPSALAFFDRGKAFPSLIMSNVTGSIDTVMLPTIAEAQNDRLRVKQMMKRSIQVSYLFVAPLLVGFFFVAKDVVIILLTEKWLPTVPFIKIFCVAFLLMPIQTINMTGIKSLGYSNITLKLEMLKKAIEAVILIISILINVYAVAWGIVIYNAICIVINLSPSKTIVDYGIFEQLGDMFPSCFVALLMGGIVYLCGYLPFNTISLLIIKVIMGAIIYYFMCRLFRFDSLAYVTNYLKEAFMNRRSVR